MTRQTHPHRPASRARRRRLPSLVRDAGARRGAGTAGPRPLCRRTPAVDPPGRPGGPVGARRGAARASWAPACTTCRATGRVPSFFVHLDRPLSWQWAEGAVLWVGPPASRRAVPIIGACAVTVVDAASFHRAFLRGERSLADGHLPRVLDAVVRDRFESRLERVTAAGETDPAYHPDPARAYRPERPFRGPRRIRTRLRAPGRLHAPGAGRRNAARWTFRRSSR